jgi:hypothetical protein
MGDIISMTTENLENNTESATQSVDAKTSEVTLTLEQAVEQNKALEAKFLEAVSDRDKSKQKLRKLEETAGSAAELQKKFEDLLAEKTKLAEQFEAATGELTSVKESVKQKEMNSVMSTALEAAGAKSISTVMKLVDKSKLQFDDKGQVSAESVIAAIEEVRSSDPILFGDLTDPKDAATDAQTGKVNLYPGVRRAGEASAEDAYTKEIKAAKSHTQIESIMRKYGKMQ